MIKIIERFFRYKFLPQIFRMLGKQQKIDLNFLKVYNPQKIILIKYHHKIGDMLLGTPVFKNLRKKYKKATIDFLAGSYNISALMNNKCIDNLYIYKKDLKYLLCNFFLLKKLKQRRYDLGIILSASSFSVSNALLGYFIKPKVLIGLEAPAQKTNITKFIYNYEVPLPARRLNETELYLRVITPLIPRPEYKDEEIYLSAEEEKIGRKFRKKFKNKILIGIHHGGTYPERQWKIENVIELIKRLIMHNYYVVLISGKSEAERYNIRRIF